MPSFWLDFSSDWMSYCTKPAAQGSLYLAPAHKHWGWSLPEYKAACFGTLAVAMHCHLPWHSSATAHSIQGEGKRSALPCKPGCQATLDHRLGIDWFLGYRKGQDFLESRGIAWASTGVAKLASCIAAAAANLQLQCESVLGSVWGGGDGNPRSTVTFTVCPTV